jgi:hypothetical protein
VGQPGEEPGCGEGSRLFEESVSGVSSGEPSANSESRADAQEDPPDGILGSAGGDQGAHGGERQRHEPEDHAQEHRLFLRDLSVEVAPHARGREPEDR